MIQVGTPKEDTQESDVLTESAGSAGHERALALEVDHAESEVSGDE